MIISGNYRKLRRDEVEMVASSCCDAWKDASIPKQQYDLTCKELSIYRSGGSVAPFDVCVAMLRRLPREINHADTLFLEIGAGAAHYSEVLRLADLQYTYYALDYSQAFAICVAEHYPAIRYQVADACDLPYIDGAFDIVMTAACLMHVVNYERALAEAIRVSHKYILLHRTPIVMNRETQFYVKEAYGVDTLEIHFSETELRTLFTKYGVSILSEHDIFNDGAFSHRAYLLIKDATFPISV